MKKSGKLRIIIHCGDYLPDVKRKAAKKALLKQVPVSFIFNERTYRITPKEAKHMLSIVAIKKVIKDIQEEMKSTLEAAKTSIICLEDQYREEIKFARKVYRNKF